MLLNGCPTVIIDYTYTFRTLHLFIQRDSMVQPTILFKYSVRFNYNTQHLLQYSMFYIGHNVDVFHLHTCFIFIFPSIYDGKIQWSTSGIENVADFCHFVT